MPPPRKPFARLQIVGRILPIGVQSFRKLRQEGRHYVDKTAYAKVLVDVGTHYFLSRPRRFGKSLLVSTLHSLFACERDLFEGLAIEPHWNWSLSRPVVHLDLSGAGLHGPVGLRRSIFSQLRSHGSHALVTLRGKGGKLRQCPLWPRTEDALARLVQGRAERDAVFLSRHRRAYTRSGVYRLVERCSARVPSLEGRKITPHVVRHTSACHLLRAGVDLNTIRAWLGHVSLDTTNIYAEIDFDTKAKAVELCDTAEPGPDQPWKEDKGLMAFLGAL